MTYELPGIPEESEIEQFRRLEAATQQMAALIKRGKDAMDRQKEGLKNLDEMNVIINGLYNQANALAEEKRSEAGRRMPESEEEWQAYLGRMEKLNRLYDLISKMETESEEVMALVEELGRRASSDLSDAQALGGAVT